MVYRKKKLQRTQQCGLSDDWREIGGGSNTCSLRPEKVLFLYGRKGEEGIRKTAVERSFLERISGKNGVDRPTTNRKKKKVWKVAAGSIPST